MNKINAPRKVHFIIMWFKNHLVICFKDLKKKVLEHPEGTNNFIDGILKAVDTVHAPTDKR